MTIGKTKTIPYLLQNTRFYILAFTIISSLFAASWLRTHIASDQLFYIRTEQVFGYASMLCWYIALIISPLAALVGKNGVMLGVIFARRAIGVSAAYFALLHVTVATWGQLGGLKGLALPPGTFRTSLLLGVVALVILCIMAATSFNKVVVFMTPKRWKWLHRLGYIGGVLVILHVWLIGTHVAYVDTRIIAFVLLAILFGLESFRVASSLAKRYKELATLDVRLTIFICLWLLLMGLLLALPRLTTSYHSEHHAVHSGSGHV
jgi:sulfoxide reductase heme-binding subunit YedZ